MRFSARTDYFVEARSTVPHLPFFPSRTPYVKQPLRRQPHYLLADVLLEIMGWLAYIDWLVCSDPLRFSVRRLDSDEQSAKPGYSLIRATHVCRYWRIVALENRSLWRHVSLSETLSRHYLNIDREFACRVHRSLGLTKELHVSYAECPIHEQLQYRYPCPVPLPPIPIRSTPSYGPASDPASVFSHFLPNGYSVTQEDLSPMGYSYNWERLYPLLLDCIKRCTVLTLKATGSTLTDLFGHTLDSESMAGAFDGTAMLSSFIHPQLPPSLNRNSISSLPLLTELTIELMDSTNKYFFPTLPALRKLTLVRQVAHPHLRPPVIYQFFDPHTLWDSATRLPSPTCPKLTEFRLFAPNVILICLHQFLIAHSRTLSSLTLHTSTDIFHPYPVPSLLHPANFAVPNNTTDALVPVPHYADNRPNTSTPAFAVNLPKLRYLSIPHLTGLLSPHIEVWACPTLDELDLTIPSSLPTPAHFLTTSYANLRRLIYRFPKSTFTRQTWNDGLLLDPDPRDVHEQGSASRLLISLLNNLSTLEELVVESWVFRHIWGEEDWIASLLPPGAVASQYHDLDDDLEVIGDDPWNPNRETPTPWPVAPKAERWQTQDGRPFDIKHARMSEAGLMLDDEGEILVLLDSDEENDGDYSDDAETASYFVRNVNPAPKFQPKADQTKPAKPTSLLCPHLSQLELRRCFGVERSLMFPCMRERLRIWEKSQIGAPDRVGEKAEVSWTQLSSIGPSQVASSCFTASSISERQAKATLPAGTQSLTTERAVLTDDCAQIIVVVHECALTGEEFRELYSQFLCGEYEVRKPRKPRPPTPIPLDQRNLF